MPEGPKGWCGPWKTEVRGGAPAAVEADTGRYQRYTSMHVDALFVLSWGAKVLFKYTELQRGVTTELACFDFASIMENNCVNNNPFGYPWGFANLISILRTLCGFR